MNRACYCPLVLWLLLLLLLLLDVTGDVDSDGEREGEPDLASESGSGREQMLPGTENTFRGVISVSMRALCRHFLPQNGYTAV